MIETERPRRRRSPSPRAKGRRPGRSVPVISYVIFALFIVAAGLVLWLTMSAVYWLSPAGAPVAVPNLVGMTYDEAASAVLGAHLGINVIARRPDSNAPKNAIIGQLPSAGERVREGRIISVIVSDGVPTAQVPQLDGLTEREAVVALENVRLDAGNVRSQRNPGVIAGTVIDQSIDPFSTVRVGTRVDLIVAAGRPLEYVPTFVGVPLSVAQAAAKERNIALAAPQFNPIARGAPPKGIIVAQDPPPGSNLEPNDKISLSVSGGPLPTPLPSPIAVVNANAALPSPDAMRGLRVSVKLPSEPQPAQFRIVVQDGTGARTVYNQQTTGGFTLWFDLSVTGGATLETYVDDQLVSATPI